MGMTSLCDIAGAMLSGAYVLPWLQSGTQRSRYLPGTARRRNEDARYLGGTARSYWSDLTRLPAAPPVVAGRC